MTDEQDRADEAIAERTRLLFARPWSFRTGVARLAQLPPPQGAEVAFAGRSNVGKSTLINAVLGQQGLARTSNTPGRTQELNFFVPAVLNTRSKKTERLSSGAPREALDNPPSIVDMPGYGFAKAPKGDVDDWTRLVFDYLRGRVTLRRVYLLIDSRHGLKPIDNEAMDALDEAAVSYQIVLTKADKIATAIDGAPVKALVADTIEKLKRHPASHPVVVVTSSDKGWGVETLRHEISVLSV